MSTGNLLRRRFQKQITVVIFMVSASILLSTPGSSAATRRVETGCCELQLPTWLKYRTVEMGLQSYGSPLAVTVDSVASSGPEDTASEIVGALGTASVTYEQSSSIWAVKSGFLRNGNIYYIRAQYDRGCGEAGVLILSYPKAKKKAYAADVAAMSKSFRADLCG
jgi:hypothetical protein